MKLKRLLDAARRTSASVGDGGALDERLGIRGYFGYARDFAIYDQRGIGVGSAYVDA